MTPRMGRRDRTASAVSLAVVIGAVLVLGWTQGEGEAARAAAEHFGPCVLRTTSLMQVTDMKALGYANNSRVVVDASGNAWVVVRSKHDREHGNCLVRAAAPWHSGMKAELTWLEDRDSIQLSTFPQRVAAIAAGPDGQIHMAWYGGADSSPDHQVHYARFSTKGAARMEELRSPFTVPGFANVAVGAAKPIELWQEHTSLAVDRDGKAYLAWEARDPSRRTGDGTPKPGIALATRSPDGKWSVNGALGRPPYLQVDERYPGQSRPSIVASDSGVVHVLCYGSVDGAQQALYGWLAPGRGFSGWKQVAPTSGDQRCVAAAIDAKGRVHAVWREGTAAGGGSRMGIYYSVRDADGRWHKPTRLSTGDENASTPAVGVTDSSVCVAWVAWTPGAANSEGQVDNGFPSDNSSVEGRLEVTSSPLGRETFEPPTVIDAGPAAYPCWAVGPSRGAARPALAWTSVDAGSGRASLRLGWCEREK